MEPGEPGAGKRKRQGQRDGDEYHARDGAGAENEQVKKRPSGIMDGAQHQQSHCGGTCQSMNDANEQRAQGVEKSEARQGPAQPTRRREAGGVMFRGGAMRMPVKMDARAVLVK